MSFLSRYHEYARVTTDGPDRFHHACALATLGAAMGRRWYVKRGDPTIFPHLWIALLGASSVSRKSTSILIARKILSQAGEGILLPAKMTTEKMFDVLSTQSEGLLVYSELQQFLTMLTREYNAELKSYLTDWWDSPAVSEYASVTGGRRSVRYPAPSILGASTPEWLEESARGEDLTGGLYPRILWIVGKRDKPITYWPEESRDENRNILSDWLKRKILSFNPGLLSPQGRMLFTNEAKGAFVEEVCKAMHREFSDERLSGFLSRGETYAVKIAMIHAASRESFQWIDVEDVLYAKSFLFDAIGRLSGFLPRFTKRNAEIRLLDAVLKAIQDAYPKGLTRRDLLRRFQIRSSALGPILDTLLEMEYVETKVGQDSRKLYFVARDMEEVYARETLEGGGEKGSEPLQDAPNPVVGIERGTDWQ